MLTEAEKIILKSTNKRWRYIARDKSGELYLFTFKPKKDIFEWGEWKCDIGSMRIFMNIFKSVKWKNKEPLEFRNEKGEFIL